MKVLGMGNALIDVLAVIKEDKILDNLSLPKGSMQLIDDARFITISNELKKLDTTTVTGGSAANTIVGLSYLNVATGFIGRIGKDSYGKYFEEELIKQHIQPKLVKGDEMSGVASTFISNDGQRTFGTYLGAASLLDSEDLQKAYFEGYSYFYIEGYLVQNYGLIRNAIVMAKEAGAKVILDLASYNIVDESRDFLLEIMPKYVDIVFANEEEAFTLYKTDPEKAVSLLAGLVNIAIVKTGSKGSWIQQGDTKVFVPALKVNCIDTTGAGDVYASGFIYGLINRLPLAKCGEIGTLLAAEIIGHIGAKIDGAKWPGLIARIQEIIKRH